jgi:SAM-dependent methyltransferase
VPEYDSYSEFYDLLYGNLQHDVPFYLRQAEQAGGPVVELACGTGRVLLPIARAGFEITGIDLSQAMLDKLQAKLDKEPREVQSRVALKCADMRDYRFTRKFRLVFCTGNSFLHLMTTDDQLACLAGVRDYLADNGRLVISVFAPSYRRLAATDETNTSLYRDPESGLDMTLTEISHRRFNDQAIDSSAFADRTGQDGTVRRYSAKVTLCWIHHREMLLLLRCAGFDIVDVYGGWDRRPFDHNSQVQIFVAR